MSEMGRGREPVPAKSLNSFAAPAAPVSSADACGPRQCAVGVSSAQNRLPWDDLSKHKPLKTDMINNTQFSIIGSINSKGTHVSVASDRQVKEDDKWTTKTDWNTVTVFSEAMRKRLDPKKAGKKGNLVIFEGSIQSLELAEFEADLVLERFLEAFETGEHPETLDTLQTDAALAQSRYDHLQSSDLAH